MKIVHLCLSCFYIDNYSYQENMLPKYHVKQGYEVTMIASLCSFNEKGQGCYLPKASTYWDKDGYKVIRLAYKNPIRLNRLFRHYEGFKEALYDEAPDIIFMHGPSFGDTPVVRQYIQKHPETRLFADNHADYINSATNFLSKKILHPIVWRHYAKVVEPYMEKCFGVTPQRCRFLKEMYHINPAIIEFLPMGVDDEVIPLKREDLRKQVRGNLGINADDFLILTGGKIDERKNTHVLLEAMAVLNNPKIHLVICGTLTPQMQYLQEKINVNKNIHYLGWCNAEQVMDNMIASDMACFPGTHSTLWEQAVGVGLPAVFKKWDEMDHVGVNGNCIFIKGEGVKELADAIQNIISDYPQYKELASAAAESFKYSNISKKAIGE